MAFNQSVEKTMSGLICHTLKESTTSILEIN